MVSGIHARSLSAFTKFIYIQHLFDFSVIIWAKTEDPDPDNFSLYHTMQKSSKMQAVILCGALLEAKPYAVLICDNYKCLNI